MLKLAVCDSNLDFARMLAKMISEISGSKNIAVFDSAEKANAYTDIKNIDCLFIDIELNGGNSGIDTAYEIVLKHPELRIVFMSPYNSDYFGQMFLKVPEMTPFAFLRKPPQRETIEKICQKLNNDINRIDYSTHYPVKTQKGIIRLEHSRIQYIECYRRKAIFVCDENNRYECYKKLSEVIEALPDNFVFCHKSYIVNINHIKLYRTAEMVMDNNDIIPISRTNSRKMRQIIDARSVY